MMSQRIAEPLAITAPAVFLFFVRSIRGRNHAAAISSLVATVDQLDGKGTAIKTNHMELTEKNPPQLQTCE